MIKAVLFDLDGVIINSEIYEQKWTSDFNENNNFNIPQNLINKMVGSNRKMNITKELYDNSLAKYSYSYEKFLKKLREYKKEQREKINYKDLLFSDVFPCLTFLHKSNIKIACASSSNLDYINKALLQSCIISFFDLIVSGDNFEESKPNPEIYKYCLNKLKCKPNEAVVVEDSSYGIEAGKKAGCIVFARKDHYFNIDQSHSDFIFDRLEKLTEFIINYNLL